jgi:hypothetical protein
VDKKYIVKHACSHPGWFSLAIACCLTGWRTEKQTNLITAPLTQKIFRPMQPAPGTYCPEFPEL